MRALTFLSFLVALIFGVTPGGAAEKRVALVIGNGAYRHAAPLRNPRNDASDMAVKLRSLGFEVIEGLDLDKREMEIHIRDFASAIEDAEVALFYYAGHGMLVRGKNHLAPVDMRFRRESDIDFETIDFDLVMRQMERSTRVNLVFLDACRDNPLAASLSSSRSSNVSRGLGRIERALGMLIAFATEPGNVAADGDGRNSPFTRALLTHMDAPGVSVGDMMIEVRNEVLKETRGRQVPWDNSSLTGRFFFNAPEAPETDERKIVSPAQDGGDLAAIRDEFRKLQLEQTARIEAQQQELASLRDRFGKPEPVPAGAAQSHAAAANPSGGETELAVEPEARSEAEAPAKAAAEPQLPSEPAPASAIAAPSAPTAPAIVPAAAPADVPASPAEPGPGNIEVAAASPIPDIEPDIPPEIDLEAIHAALTREIQAGLSKIGCYRGTIDGRWGSGTRAAVERFNGLANLDLDPEDPGEDIVNALKAWTGGNCEIEAARPKPEKAAPHPSRAAPRAAPKAAPIERARKREKVRQRIERQRPAAKSAKSASAARARRAATAFPRTQRRRSRTRFFGNRDAPHIPQPGLAGLRSQSMTASCEIGHALDSLLAA